MNIVEDDLKGPKIHALLKYHLEQMHLSSPPGSVFAFDIDRLRADDVTFWTAWEGDTLLGCGALKSLDSKHGELKSFRTDPNHLRKGAAAALLNKAITVARARGFARLSLETGSGLAFDPALSLYRRLGFVDGAPFGSYEASPFSQFLHLEL